MKETAVVQKEKGRIEVGASILASDFSQLGAEMSRIEKAGIDFFHIDIMDGHFVPNITIGPAVVKDVRGVTALPFDVHLMIENPLNWVEHFISAGADMITLHIETVSQAACRRKAAYLKSKGVRIGVSLNPATPLKKIEGLLDVIDFVLVMTVNPGFGGQKFIEQVLTKIKALRGIYDGKISVDGGINAVTAGRAVTAGANVLCCGTFIFKSVCPDEEIHNLRKCGGINWKK